MTQIDPRYHFLFHTLADALAMDLAQVEETLLGDDRVSLLQLICSTFLSTITWLELYVQKTALKDDSLRHIGNFPLLQKSSYLGYIHYFYLLV